MKVVLRDLWEYFLISIISFVIIIFGYSAMAFFWTLGLFFRLTHRK